MDLHLSIVIHLHIYTHMCICLHSHAQTLLHVIEIQQSY